MTVLEAVRALRQSIGDTQQQFAGRLSLAISTVVRYELTRPPKGAALISFHQLALKQGRNDLANIFWDAAAEELGQVGIQGVSDIYNVAMKNRKQLLVNQDPSLNPDETGAYHEETVDCVTVLEDIARRCVEINPALQYSAGQHLENAKPKKATK